MFNFLLKKNLPTLILCSLLCLTATKTTTPAQPTSESAKSDIQKISTASDIREAKTIICEVKEKLSAFFNKKNKKSYNWHISQLSPIIEKMEKLKLKYEEYATVEEQDQIILFVLRETYEPLVQIFNVLDKKYWVAAKLGFALSKTINKYASDKKMNALNMALESLRPLLNPNERQELESLILELSGFKSIVPSNKFTCLQILRKRIKAKG